MCQRFKGGGPFCRPHPHPQAAPKMPILNRVKEDQRKFIVNNKIILKVQQTFTSERRNVFTEEINKIDLGSNDRINSINSINSIKEYNQLIR